MRELKTVMMEREVLDELRELVQAQLHDLGVTSTAAPFDKLVPSLVKCMIGVSSNLNQSKDVRDMLVTVMDKAIEPMVKQRVRVDTLSLVRTATDTPHPPQLLAALGKSFKSLTTVSAERKPALLAAWNRCFKGSECVLVPLLEATTSVR